MLDTRRVFLLLAGLFMAGCARSNYPEIVPVSGKLLFEDGKPLPAGTRLYFHPVLGVTGTAVGITEADGTFTVRHESGLSGAAVGQYTVQLAAPEGDRSNFFRIVPKNYFDGTGAITLTVTPAMDPVQFKVKRSARR